MRSLLSASVLAALLTLTACSSDDSGEGSINNDPPAGTNAPEATSEASPVEADSDATDVAEEETTTEPAITTPTFGQAFSYDNGVTITVGEPKPYKPSNSAAGGGETNVVFTVTVVNGTAAPYEISGDSISVQAGNREAEQIFDSAKGLEGTPTTPVLPGREAEFEVAFNVADPTDLVMAYQPNDYELDPIYFTS